jgi:hypothetical protein
MEMNTQIPQTNLLTPNQDLGQNTSELKDKIMPISVDDTTPLSTLDSAVNGTRNNMSVGAAESIIHVDEAIAPSISELVLDDVDAEPSDWWWDHAFDVYSEEHLGRYGC